MERTLCIVVAALAACSDAKPQVADWPMYGLDAHHSFHPANSSINAGNATKLKQAWSFPTGDAVSASPIVVGGTVYAGSWDGNFYALDLASGKVVWQFQVDCQPALVPVPPQCLAGQPPPDRMDSDGGVLTGSAAVADGIVYVGGGRTMYALDAKTGALVWKHVLCGKPEDPACESDANDPANIFSSPTIFEGKVLAAESVDGATGYRGYIVALDAATGALVWRFEVDPMLDSNGNPLLDGNGNVVGGVNRGCGSVWGSAAIDEVGRLVYFGTGDCQSDAPPPYHEAVLAIDIDTGKIRWAYRPRATDTCDFDFGASANVIDVGGQRMVGMGGKDGTYYLLDAASGQLAWSRNVVFGGAAGGFIGTPAFDGTNVFGATAPGELGGQPCMPSDPRDSQLQDPSLHAIALADGSVAWEQPMAYSVASTTIGNGVLFNGLGAAGLPSLAIYDASSGDKIIKLPADGSANSGATVVGNTVLYGTGNSYNGQGGAIVAYHL